MLWHQMMFLLVTVKHTLILNIFMPNFLHCVLQTLDEIASVERIKTQHRSNSFQAKKMRVKFGSSEHALL